MFELIDNTLNNQYSKGALLKIEDPDDGNRKWVVGTIVGNVIMNTGEELESLLRSERMAHAYELVWKLSDAIVTELSSRSPNRIKLFFRGAFAGLLSGHQQQINLTNVLVPKITEVFKIMKG
jgi:hypothetical protein